MFSFLSTLISAKSDFRPDSRQNLFVISLTYFFYFGLLGVIVPYVSVFLDGRGFSSEQIGSLIAIVTITRVFGPNIWAAVADKSGKVAEILRFGCITAFLVFLLVFVSNGFWQLTLSFGLMMTFWTAVLPQLEVITVKATQSHKRGYGAVRLWGSIGFIVLTIVVGALLDVFGSEVVIYAISLGLFSLYLSSLFISTTKTNTVKRDIDDQHWSLVFTLPFIAFITCALLLQVSFASYYNFFALYMNDLKYSGTQTGFFIALSVASEVVIFLVATRILRRFSVKWLLCISLLITAFRWFLLAQYADFIALVVFSQLLHAFSFGMTHAAAIHFLHNYFPNSFQSRGQALYSSIAFGMGGALGSFISGIFWQQGEGAHFSFMLSASIALLASLIVFCVPAKRFATR